MDYDTALSFFKRIVQESVKITAKAAWLWSSRQFGGSDGQYGAGLSALCRFFILYSRNLAEIFVLSSTAMLL
jgi:hypothetical protein